MKFSYNDKECHQKNNTLSLFTQSSVPEAHIMYHLATKLCYSLLFAKLKKQGYIPLSTNEIELSFSYCILDTLIVVVQVQVYLHNIRKFFQGSCCLFLMSSKTESLFGKFFSGLRNLKECSLLFR